MSIDRLSRLVFGCTASIWLQPTTERSERNSRLGSAEKAKATMPHQARKSEAAPIFALRLRYKGRERTTELPLTPDVIGQLASRAEFRQIRIGELVGDLLLTVAKKDLFRQVLDTHSSDAPDEGGREPYQ
jgi:hypothetical protein